MEPAALASSPLHATARRTFATLAALWLLSAGLSAQSFRYGLQADGKVVVDTSILDNAAGTLIDMEVIGSDRFVLNTDGIVYANGTLLRKLPKFFAWTDLDVDVVGEARTVYAIRQDGLVAANDNLPVQYPVSGTVDGDPLQPANWPFLSLAVDGGTVWGLRVDGRLFKGASTTPAFAFGEVGEDQPYFWTRVAVDPTSGQPHALRSDGVISIGDAGDGTSEVVLPPPPPLAPFNSSALYQAIDFLSDGSFVALRGNGEVYTASNPLVPLVDFGDDEFYASSLDELFFGLAVHDGEIWAIRYDGKVYRQDAPETPLFDYTKKGYLRLTLSGEPPDISNIKNSKPTAVRYKVTSYGNDTLRIPIVATDVDLAESELVVEVVDAAELPVGVGWTASNRMLVFDQALAPGSYKVTVTVDDGVNKKVKAKTTVVVKTPDTDPDKNKKPVAAKIKAPGVLVGRPFAITILADDADGDAITITPKLDKGPFAIPDADIHWDAATATMTWTPVTEDIGKHTAEFTVSDATSSKSVKLKLVVLNSLVFDTDEPPPEVPFAQQDTRSLPTDD